MFSKILRSLLITQAFVCYDFNIALTLEQQFQSLINLDRRHTIERTEIALSNSKVVVSPTDCGGILKISGNLAEFNNALLYFAKFFKKANRITSDLEPVLLYYTFEIDMMGTAICQHIADLTYLHMIPFLIYEGIVDRTKCDNALKDRLQLIERLYDIPVNLLPTDANLLHELHSSIYRNLMLLFINAPIKTVEGASRNPGKDGTYIIPKSITEYSRNIKVKLESLVEPDIKSWKDRIENSPTLTDLRRLLLATCFCHVSFMTGRNSSIYPRNILVIHRNFFEDSYIAEHASSKHLTPDADSNGDFASFFDFDSSLPIQGEAQKEELERRARIVAESMYQWVLNPNFAQICVEPSGEEFNVFLKVTDLGKTPDIKQLVYSSKSGKTVASSDTVKFPIKSLSGKYTLSKSAFPCKDKSIPPETTDPDPFKKKNLLNIPDVSSTKKTLLDELNTIPKATGMTSEQKELFEQLNIDDISWIVGEEIYVNPTFHGVSFSELLVKTPPDLVRGMVDNFKRHKPNLIEEIWFINKGSVSVTSLF